ncbi:hypothetical protein XELAEV_18031419mg [Xenopus laevis]|uniref:Uncharacterized protein n=1 Tax=Xenopus laevis TaxID=8355 RepID=A0A974HFQ1_XENLA|nr:hypothetical protein XELAEV_18031419mg [Xenopus laevis]
MLHASPLPKLLVSPWLLHLFSDTQIIYATMQWPCVKLNAVNILVTNASESPKLDCGRKRWDFVCTNV